MDFFDSNHNGNLAEEIKSMQAYLGNQLNNALVSNGNPAESAYLAAVSQSLNTAKNNVAGIKSMNQLDPNAKDVTEDDARRAMQL